ncbi:hypothetical protein AVEN_233235-1 [Araneus ventricosus]|uniref:Uncharacterized protein n=1 Tax=Araneus ventricosus TaxID=182803 RepID=A0A4Y2EIR6_ARAVE|nr:hypothetical protein AVEN_233235-1 [Araneus ventricosus]
MLDADDSASSPPLLATFNELKDCPFHYYVKRPNAENASHDNEMDFRLDIVLVTNITSTENVLSHSQSKLLEN